jgi:chromosome segregation protein
LLESQASKRSQLNVLEQLNAEREGFSAGSIAALRQSQHVLGSLVDKIRVSDQFVTAIETALGHHLQLILTEHPEAAHQILSDLNTKRQGRATVAPLAFFRNGQGIAKGNGHAEATHGGGNGVSEALPSTVGANPEAAEAEDGSSNVAETALVMSETPSVPELNGVPLPALKVVTADDCVRSLLHLLLNETRIVRDLHSATADWSCNRGRFDYVTLGGEVLSRHGIYTGGSWGKRKRQGCSFDPRAQESNCRTREVAR